MRDIKFRAWCETEKHMYNWNNLLNQNLKNIFTITKSCGYNLMQYTELKDENGKEIYEGDIVESYGRKFVVEYRKDRGGFSPFACGDGCGCCEDEVVSQYALENNSAVIGNIYDNPDLLEEGAEE